MKKKELFVIIFFNIFALPLLLYAVIMYILFKTTKVLPYMFGQVGIVAILMCLAFGITIEGVMLFFFSNRKEKASYLFT